MPHKRSKFSVRQENAKNSDLPPTGSLTLSQESVPKKIMRVLQAEQIRKTYREKRVREDDKNESGKPRDAKRRKKDDDDLKPLVIKHGESLKNFNRRVEDEMRGQVAEAMQTSRSITKKANKLEKKAKEDRIAAAQGTSKPKKTDDSPNSEIDASTPTETKPTKPVAEMDFAKAEQRKRLNDIVQEPPTFTKLPRGVKSTTTSEGIKTGVVLPMMMQKRMEIERERAIKRYRELKEKQLAEKKT